MKNLPESRQALHSGIGDPSHWQSSLTLIKYAIAAQLLGSVCYFVALHILLPDQIGRLGGAVMSILMASMGWHLLSRGKVQASVKIQAYGLWAIVTTVAIFVGGVRAPLVIVYPVLILMLGWLLGSRSARVMTGLTLASTLGFLTAGLTNILPPGLPSSTMLYGVVQIVICLLAWMLIRQVIEAYQDRLLELKKNSRELSMLAQDLHESNARLSAIFQASPLCIIISRLNDDIIIELNDATLQQFGYGRDEVIGQRTAADLGVYADPTQHAQLVQRLSDFGSVHQFPINCLTRDAKHIVMEVSARIIELHGEPCNLAMMADVTDRHRAEAAIHEQAFRDSLTRLPNRRVLSDRLRQTMSAAKRSGCYGALMFLDLDNFKALNDRHGHDVGDLLLIEVARRLTCCVRDMATVARVGGDEFVLMLSELSTDMAASKDQALAVAEKLRSSLAIPYHFSTVHEGVSDTLIEHHCTGSIGVALFVNDDASDKEVMHWADAAMYQTKRSGGNAIRFHLAVPLPQKPPLRDPR